MIGNDQKVTTQLLLKNPDHPAFVSFGGGVDSTAMSFELESLGVRVDEHMFADTGSERPETYEFIPIFDQWMRLSGRPGVTTVRYVPKRFKHVKYKTLEENCLVNKTLPSLAFGRKSCSIKWKHAPMDKHVESTRVAHECWKAGFKVVRVIGYDAGPKDSRRAWDKTDDEKYHYWYPLREWGWDRERCIERIREAGLEPPVKSSCFFCPAMQTHEVEELVRDHPGHADRIIAMEKAAKPNLRNIEGLWRRSRKRDKRPGDMTTFIERLREKGAAGG